MRWDQEAHPFRATAFTDLIRVEAGSYAFVNSRQVKFSISRDVASVIRCLPEG